MRHQDRIVLVTGALGGIGDAIVRRYLEEGARVALVDFNEQAGSKTVNALKEKAHEVVFACADVSDFDQSKCVPNDRSGTRADRHLGAQRGHLAQARRQEGADS